MSTGIFSRCVPGDKYSVPGTQTTGAKGRRSDHAPSSSSLEGGGAGTPPRPPTDSRHACTDTLPRCLSGISPLQRTGSTPKLASWKRAQPPRERGSSLTPQAQIVSSCLYVCVCPSVSLSLALFPTAPFCLPAVFRWTIGLIFSYMKMVTSSHGEGVVGLRQTWSWLTPGGHQLSSVNPEKKDLPQHLCK